MGSGILGILSDWEVVLIEKRIIIYGVGGMGLVIMIFE